MTPPTLAPRARRLRRAPLVLLLGLASACAVGPTPDYFSPATPLRPAQDAPARFEPPAGFARVAPADTIAGSTCLSPMTDPRDGTALRMDRASGGRADYLVPPGRYGVGPGEWLRLDCNTGAPLGIVGGR